MTRSIIATWGSFSKSHPKLTMNPNICYFYNTGGCYNSDGTVKSQGQCQYRHIKFNGPMEKPQHLKPPCKYYHIRKYCKDPYCVFGHSELTHERWPRYFPTHPYPGTNYSTSGKIKWVNTTTTEPSTEVMQTSVTISQSLEKKNRVKATILKLMLQVLDEIS